MIVDKVYKGGIEICKIYKGGVLVWSVCPDNVPVAPSGLTLTEVEVVGTVPVAPTGLALTEVEVIVPSVPVAPTGLTLTEVETGAVAPNAPTSLAAGTSTETTIPLTWVKSTSGVMTEYRIYWSGTLIETFVGDVALGTLTGLSPETTYSNLSVRAYDGSLESADSNLINATTQATPVSAPVAPTGLTLTEVEIADVPVAPSGLTLTEVEQGVAPVVGTIVVESQGSDNVIISCPFTISAPNTFTIWALYVDGALWGNYIDNPIDNKYISGLTSGPHSLYIIVYDDGPSFGISPTLNINLSAAPIAPSGLTLTEVETAGVVDPTGLSAGALTYTDIPLSWTHAVPAGDFHEIVYKKQADVFWSTKIVYGGLNTYTLTGLDNFVYYDIKVQAKYNDFTSSGYTNTITVRTPEAPAVSNPTAPLAFEQITPFEDYIYMRWNAGGGDVAGYNIYVNGSSVPIFSYDRYQNVDDMDDYTGGKRGYLIHGSVYVIEIETVGVDGSVSPTRLISGDVYTTFFTFDQNATNWATRDMNPTRRIGGPDFTLENIGTWQSYEWYESGVLVGTGQSHFYNAPTRTKTYKGRVYATNWFEHSMTITVVQ